MCLGHPAEVRKGRHPSKLGGTEMSPSGWWLSGPLKNGQDWLSGDGVKLGKEAGGEFGAREGYRAVPWGLWGWSLRCPQTSFLEPQGNWSFFPFPFCPILSCSVLFFFWVLLLLLFSSVLPSLSLPSSFLSSASFPFLQYSRHSLWECLLKIDGNGHMGHLRAYLGFGSLEHNWWAESRWMGQEYCSLPTQWQLIISYINGHVPCGPEFRGYGRLLRYITTTSSANGSKNDIDYWDLTRLDFGFHNPGSSKSKYVSSFPWSNV